MKQALFLSVLTTLIIYSCTTPAIKIEKGQHVLLQDNWCLTNSSSGISIDKAHVPSTVAGTLLENSLHVEDTTIFSTSWTFTKDFKIEDPDLFYSLRFDGLNYRADIVFNGTPLASKDTTEGVFCIREFNISSLVGKDNHLEVTVEKARRGDLNIGYVDWNPAPADASMGIIRDVTLHASGPVAIRDIYVRSFLAEDYSEAKLQVNATVANLSDKSVDALLKGDVEGHDFSEAIQLNPYEVKAVCINEAARIQSPRLWWSRDLGLPQLYSLNLSAYESGVLSDTAETSFGIRRLESRLDEYGHRAYWLNGQKLLILGAGWTDDMFLSDTHESIERQVRQVADMNLNCIRFENIWGKDSHVYDMCDRLGILALVGWSCQWEWEAYCGIEHDNLYGCILDEARVTLAARYFKDQVRWLRSHPSVIGWLGGSDRIPTPGLERAYLDILSGLCDIPYICSASSLGGIDGPSGNKMVGPYEYEGPEYWYDGQHRLGSAWGFNTETSTGMNIPQIESLYRMLGDNVWPLGSHWNEHCTTAAEGMHDTSVMEEVVRGQFGEAPDLESFVARAQAADYDGTRAMFEAFRVRRGQATGVIQWMLNSAWPSLYWQLYDWYGVPTAGYYGVKKGCESVQILYDWERRQFYAVNGTLQDTTVSTNIRFYSSDSRLISDCPVEIIVPKCSSVEIKGVEVPGEDVFAFIGTGNAYAIPIVGNIHKWEKSNWFRTPIERYADLRYLTALPKPDLSINTSYSEDKYCITVRNNGDCVAWQIVLKLLDRSGRLIVPATWSDNFFPLEPGAECTVTCTAPKGASVAWTAGL